MEVLHLGKNCVAPALIQGVVGPCGGGPEADRLKD